MSSAEPERPFPAALCCPACRAKLVPRLHAERSLDCASCGGRYPVILGIPDLRVGGDPYLSLDDDRAAALRLAERADLGLVELLESYYLENPKVSPAQAKQFTRGVAGAASRAAGALDAWALADGRGGADESRDLLDIGCGTAPLAAAAAARGHRVVAVDVGLRWLVMARRRLEEAGLSVPLICANAEALPFQDGSFDTVAGESVIENVAGQSQALLEARRVLRSGGRLWLTMPNRFSIGPDPHVGLLAGGYLPSALIAAYARRKGGVPPRRHLYGEHDLSAALTRAGFSGHRFDLPDVPPGQRATMPGWLRPVVGAYRIVRRTPIASSLLRLVAPTLSVTSGRDDRPARR